MASPAPLLPAGADRPIGNYYIVDATTPLPGAGGGSDLVACRATDRRDPARRLMAVPVRGAAPARLHAINQLLAGPVPGLLGPLAHGPARDAAGQQSWFVICEAPPGPPLRAGGSRAAPWGEAALLERVLRPAARVLEQLEARRVTHRAIRPENLFRPGPAAGGDGEAHGAVVLGSAWAAPPASRQPAIYEPPYVAMCLPGGRGDGSIADDVYALGVTLLVLALGHEPLAELAPDEIVRRKLERGSLAALLGEARLPMVLTDLLRGMLAEDPEHRPAPAMLADPGAAGARRVAARPPRRAGQPLQVGPHLVWTARTLAHALASEPEVAARLLRLGMVDRWLRRSLGDVALAARLAEPGAGDLHGGAPGAEPDLAVMRAVAVLDPLAPLCWRGIAFWPDGLGPALAAALADKQGEPVCQALQQAVSLEAQAGWAQARADRCDAALARADAHNQRALLRVRGWGGGLPRLAYAINPLLACRSPLLGPALVMRPADLPAALEAAASRPEARTGAPIDRDIAAFLAARCDPRIEADVLALNDPAQPERSALTPLRLLAGLQLRAGAVPLPGLAGWLAAQASPAFALWRSRERREAVTREVQDLAALGQLDAMLALLDDPVGQAEDTRAYQEALIMVHEIDSQLAALRAQEGWRAARARRLGQEAVAGFGAIALSVAAIAAALG
ncbi:MAG: hypothetical protein KGJ41_00425 [Rhodospirillales bacterium]|nr:hypothetical protein [Rhodospirillales bacterium]